MDVDNMENKEQYQQNYHIKDNFNHQTNRIKVKKDKKQFYTQKFIDRSETKNKINKTCKEHNFCNFNYDWEDPQKDYLEFVNPQYASKYEKNIQTLLNQKEKVRYDIKFSEITEENIDNWIAQSQNIQIRAMLDPKKQFDLPKKLVKQLKDRYRQVIQETRIQDQKCTFTEYFRDTNQQKNELPTYERIQPMKFPGTSVFIREENELLQTGLVQKNKSNTELFQKNQQIQKQQNIKSIDNQDSPTLLNQPSQQKQELKQLIKQSNSVQPINQQQKNKTQTTIYNKTEQDNKLYTYNIENLLRNRTQDENVATSIAQKELELNQLKNEMVEKKKKQKMQQGNQGLSVQQNNEQFKEKVSKITLDTQKYMINPPKLKFTPKLIDLTQNKNNETQNSFLTNNNFMNQTSKSQQKNPFMQQSKKQEVFTRGRQRNYRSTSTQFYNQKQLNNSMLTTFQKQKKEKQIQPNFENLEINLPQNDYMQSTQNSNFNTTVYSQQFRNLKNSSNNTNYNDIYKKSQTQTFQYQSIKEDSINSKTMELQDQSPQFKDISITEQIKRQDQQSIQSSFYRPKSVSISNNQQKFNENNNLKNVRKKTNSLYQKSVTNVSEISEDKNLIKQKNLMIKKVDKLLNSHSENNLINFNQELIKIDLHIDIENDEEENNKNNFKNKNKTIYKKPTQVEYWFKKGINQFKSQNNNIQMASECFKQAIITDKIHFQSIFNLACLYERQEKFKNSKAWFFIALEIVENQIQYYNQKKPQDQQEIDILIEKQLRIYYGITLSCYKLIQFQEAYNSINKLIDISNQTQQQKVQEKYLYLRAIICKQLGKIEQAEQEYKPFYQNVSPQDHDLLRDFMFLFSLKFKQKINKYIDMKILFAPRIYCQFCDTTSQIIETNIYTPLLSQYYINNPKQSQITGWDYSQKTQIIQKLKSISFFNRFACSVLEKFLPSLKLQIVGKNTLLHPHKQNVFIITAGITIIYDHTEDYLRPKIVSYYKQGDIICGNELENFISMRSNLWIITQTEQLEYVEIDKKLFDQLWKAQMTIDGELITQNLNSMVFFKKVSALTMYKLVYELFQVKYYQKGDIIFNDCTYLDKYQGVDYISMVKIKKTNRYISQMLTQWQFKEFVYMTKIQKLWHKHKKAILARSFNKRKIDGFYIILEGQVEIEDDKGFRGCTLQEQDYFGENLMIKTKGVSNFGRIICKSDQVKLLFLPRQQFNKINSIDKVLMENNCQNSEIIKNIEYKRNRYLNLRKLKLRRQDEERQGLYKTYYV